MLRYASVLGALALLACGNGPTIVVVDGSATSTGDELTSSGPRASTSSVSATSFNGTSEAPSSDGLVDSTGSSTSVAIDTTTSSTGVPDRCVDGIWATGRGEICVGLPQILDPQPAYDVVGLDDIYATVGTGVRRFRRDDLTAPPQDVALGGRGQDIVAAWLDQRRSKPSALLVTLPDDDLLAVIPRDAKGDIGEPAMYPTGASPQQVTYLPVGSSNGYVTANAGDGTLSRFASLGDGGPLVPMPAIEIGGSPHSIAIMGHHLGVLDPNEGVLRVLTFDDAFEVSSTESYAVEDQPVALRPLLYSDVGPNAFLVASAGANLISAYAASTGVALGMADYPGSPVGFAPDGVSTFFDGQSAMAVVLGEADRIAISQTGGGRQFVLNPPTFEVPTAEDPAAVVVIDFDGDGALDFVTASPTSGVAVVLQQL